MGSGGAGLAAAWAAHRAGARVTVITKGTAASCNTGKAQGGIQAAIGEDDSPEQHAGDVYRSSHDTADLELVEALTGDAPGAISWLEGLGVEFSREGDGYRLARCGGATAKRLLQVGDRTGHAIAHALRGAMAAEGVQIVDHTPLVALERPNGHFLATVEQSRRAAHDGRRHRGAGRRRAVLRRGARARGADHQPARRDRRGGRNRRRDRRRGARHGLAAAPPQRRRLAAAAAGLLDPGDHPSYGALLVNAEGERFIDELAPRDTVADAIVRECEEGRGLTTPDGRPAVLLDTRPIEPETAAQVLPYMLRRYRAAGVDPLAEPILTYPVLHYQNGGLVIGTRRAAPPWRACTPPERSPAGCTAATG